MMIGLDFHFFLKHLNSEKLLLENLFLNQWILPSCLPTELSFLKKMLACSRVVSPLNTGPLQLVAFSI